MLRINALMVVCETLITILSGSVFAGNTLETSRQVVLDLKDGSRLIGSTGLRTISLDSEAIHQIDIPIERVRTIKVDKQHKVVTVSLSNGDQVHGTVRMRPLEVQTLFGSAEPSVLKTRATPWSWRILPAFRTRISPSWLGSNCAMANNCRRIATIKRCVGMAKTVIYSESADAARST
jgi:hypothetical protein